MRRTITLISSVLTRNGDKRKKNSEVHFQAKLLLELAVPVPYRHFRDAGHVRDLLLGLLLPVHRARDVEGGRGDARRASPRYQALAERLADELDSLLLHLAAELEGGRELRHVLRRVGERHIDVELGFQEAVGPAYLLLLDAGGPGNLVERPRDPLQPADCVDDGR